MTDDIEWEDIPHYELCEMVIELRAEIERLRAAGDALAAAYTDAIFEEDGHPEMDEDLTAWNEARRG